MSTWLEEDPELLEAALELVDAWDDGNEPHARPWVSTSESGTDDAASTISSSHGGRSSLLNSPFAATEPCRSKKRVVKPTMVQSGGCTTVGQRRNVQPSTLRSTHHRRRHEINCLTAKVAELMREVQALDQAKRNALCLKPDGTRGDVDRARAIMWHDIALRQQQLRSAAESEHAKLRELVDAHVAVVREMVNLIQRARRLQDDEMMRSIKRQRFVPTGAVHIHQADQLRCIDEMYRNMDRFHSHPRFHDGTTQFIDVQFHEDRPQAFVVDVSEVSTVPFAENRVMDALWQYSFKRQAEGLCAPEFLTDADLQSEEEELVSKFTALSTIGVSQGAFDGRAVVKRYPKTETSPPAIITSICCTPSESAAGDFEGVGNHGLSAIRVLPLTAGTEDQPITRVTYTERFTVTFEANSSSRHHAAIISHMAVDKLKKNVDLMHETVEALLLTSCEITV